MNESKFRILTYWDTGGLDQWKELEAIVTERSYGPSAQEIGERYGEGRYLILPSSYGEVRDVQVLVDAPLYSYAEERRSEVLIKRS